MSVGKQIIICRFVDPDDSVPVGEVHAEVEIVPCPEFVDMKPTRTIDIR